MPISEVVIKALHQDEDDLTEFGLVINDCKNLILNFTNTVKISSDRRAGNRVAHRLGQFASLDTPMVWVEDEPLIVVDFLLEKNFSPNE